MNVDVLLSMLKKVRKNGHQRWMACCPAHDDMSASLSILEAEDGRILIHCFSGCPAAKVVGAIGLSLRDIMPDVTNWSKGKPPTKGTRHYLSQDDWRGMVATAKKDILVVQIAAAMMARGDILSYEDLNELGMVAFRLSEMLEKT